MLLKPVSTYEQGCTLRETGTLIAYTNAAQCLGDIHRIFGHDLPARDYRRTLAERLRTGPFAHYAEQFMAHWQELWQHIDGIPLYDKDPHGDNWLVKPDGKIIILDLPSKGRTDQCIQLAKLSEHTELFGHRLDERVSLYSAYASRAPHKSIKHLTQGALAATPLVAANAYHYSEQGRAPRDMTAAYLDNAEWALARGRAEFGWDAKRTSALTHII